MKGRRPVPLAVRLLEEGKLRNRPSILEGTPTQPEWLSVAAKEEWNRVAPELAAAGLLTQLDRAALAAYCQTYARYVEVQEALEREGMIIASGRPHPLCKVASDLLKHLKVYSCELGFTPAARGRIDVPPLQDAESDDFDEWEKRGADTSE